MSAALRSLPPDTVSRPRVALRKIRSLRCWLQASIANRVAASAALLIALIVLLLAALAYSNARGLLLRNVHDGLTSDAVLLANRTELMLASVERDVASLAANSLIVSGLLDSGGRSSYLDPFLRDHKLPVATDSAMTLVDHRGATLASNAAGGRQYRNQAWLTRLLSNREPVAEVIDGATTPRLLIAYPVIFPITREPEGALVLELSLAPLFAQAASALRPMQAAHLHLNDRLIASRQRTAASDGAQISVRQRLAVSQAIDRLGLEVEVNLPRELAVDGLNGLARNVIGIGLVALLLAAVASWVAARRLLRPLADLSELARRIRKERRFDLRLPTRGADEIGQLGDSFNHMIASIREAKENLEGEVAARTAALEQTRARLDTIQQQMNDGLLVVDQAGVVQAYSGGAPRLFERHAQEVQAREVTALIPQWHAAVADASAALATDGRFQRKLDAKRGETDFVADLSVSPALFDGQLHWVVLVRDATEQQRVEDRLRQANEQLNRSIAALSRHGEDMEQINRLHELISSCRGTAEAYEVIARALGQLFRDHAGALAVLSPGGAALEVVASWGPNILSFPVFSPQDCWAVRLGRAHHACDAPCQHHAEKDLALTCMPLSLQGETFGLLMAATAADAEPAEAQRFAQLLGPVAETIKFGLSNLRLRESLAGAAMRDALTGLFNRRYLDETAPSELARARREGRTVAVAMIDVDFFKRVNDSYGHEAGDHVLREIARVLRENLRESDIACRIGGEELVALLPDASAAEAAARLEQIRARIEQLTLRHGDQILARVTVSAGVACYPEHGESMKALLGAADAALYAAKGDGRNRVALAHKRLHAHSIAA